MLALTVLALILAPHQAPVKDLPVGPEKFGFLGYGFSSDCKRIVYTRVDDISQFARSSKLDPEAIKTWVANVDGSNPQIVATGIVAASFSRDGTKLLYAKRDVADIFSYDVASKVETSLGVHLLASEIACSPTEDKIAFSVSVSGQRPKVVVKSFTCNADGTDVRQIAFGKGSAYTPRWSPDGKRITLYIELGDNKDQIYLMNEDGSGMRHLSDAGKHNFYPDFGPGGLITYTELQNQIGVIAFVDQRGHRKGTFPYRTQRLLWSTDGKKAIFAVGDRKTGFSLYVSDADGGNLKRIGQP